MTVLALAASVGLAPPAYAEPSAPDAPTAVVAVAANGSAAVTWVAPLNNGGSPILSYTVTTNGPSAPAPVTVAVTAAVITGLTNGSSYSFSVVATNANGDGPSATSNVIISGTPDAPTAVSGTADNASVHLSWTAPAANGSAITSYHVTTTGAGAPAPFDTGSASTSTTVNGLTNGSSYTFKVAATNANGTGPDSSASAGVTPRTVPDAPTSVAATPGDASASLTWSAPADNGGATITSYTITTTGTGAPAPIVTGNGSTSRTISGLTNGNSYTFTVAATNVAGDGPDSTSSNAVVPLAVPGAPTGVSAVGGPGSATLSWTAPADTGGSAITSYHITTTGTGAPGAIDTPTAATTVMVTGLTNGNSYTFTVAATNSVGTGTDSSASNSITPLASPGAPTNVAGTPGNASASVSWTTPADTGGTAVISYTITVTGPNAPGPIATGTAATTRVVTGLTNGGSYTFTVAATNAVGTGADSSASAAVVPRTVPGAPTGVAAAPANASAVVTWSAPADNGGAAITSYVVTTHGSGPIPGPVTALAPATGAAIGGLTNGVSYTFTVAAVNVAGTGADSAASNAVVPLTVPTQPTSVTAKAGDGSVKVSWSPPTDSGGSAISAYTVTIKLLGAEVTHVVVSGLTTTSTIGGLTNGTTYSVTVAAANNSGSGPASFPVSVTPAADISVKRASTATGYWMIETDGTVHPFGQARYFGSPKGQLGAAQAVDIEATPSGAGYWILATDGRIFAFGDAAANYFGDVNPSVLAAGEQATSLSSTPNGAGYLVFTTRGRAIKFGNAHLFGDMSAVALNGPVLDSVITPSGNGYFMVASDGGIFAFGDAVFVGSMGGIPLNAPVQSLVPDSDGDGYWLVAADGGIFAFHAVFKGSMGGVKLNQPVVGMVRFSDGYLMVAADGGIFDFSSADYLGSLGASPPPNAITAVAALEA